MNASLLSPDRFPRSHRDPECEWRLETLGLVAEGVAHDFNNILAAISGFAELILAGGSGESRPGPAGPGTAASRNAGSETLGFAKHILEAALAGQTCVRELRAISRPVADPAEELDPNELVRQSVALCRGALGNGVRVRTELAPTAARLRGYRGLLQNAFLNLFINARDAMPKGGALTIRSWTRDADSPDGAPEWVVSIRDSGVGMDPGVRERIFDRYFTTKGDKGSGLGLAQVLDAVERHGGRIGVESEPGAGSEFRLFFPVERPD